jgi:hypothetical protein
MQKSETANRNRRATPAFGFAPALPKNS